MSRLTYRALLLGSLLFWGCGNETDPRGTAANTVSLARIVFVTQPQTSLFGEKLPPIVLEGRDQFDQIIPISQGRVELRLDDAAGKAKLLHQGQVADPALANVNSGQARFEDLGVDWIGSNYHLLARYQIPGSGQMLTAQSSTFEVQRRTSHDVVYLRSQERLWEQHGGAQSNVDALNQAFGAGNWTEGRLETADASQVFQGNRLVYLEGSDQGSPAFASFLQTHSTTLRNFVAAGGQVFANAAPNSGGNLTTPFEATIAYTPIDYESRQVEVLSGHSVGAACNGTRDFQAGFFGHGFIVGSDLEPVIVRETSPLARQLTLEDQVVLAEGHLQGGTFLLGAMTTSNFHSPSPQAQLLRANLLRYAAGYPLLMAGPVGPRAEQAGTNSSSR